jgi:ketosteroid isomerase-like protein
VAGAEASIRQAYVAFNARDIDGALATMHPEVTWPNGWEGGWVYGHAGVRGYWSRQWAAFDPHVEPLDFRCEADGRIAVRVRQVVRDRTGQLLHESEVEHVYELRGGAVTRMEIRRSRTDG